MAKTNKVAKDEQQPEEQAQGYPVTVREPRYMVSPGWAGKVVRWKGQHLKLSSLSANKLRELGDDPSCKYIIKK
jgi:hypothetical protein